jgi:NitT/TauT family transport system permease protein
MKQDLLNRQEWMLYSLLGIGLFFSIWYGAVFLQVTPKQFLPAPHEVFYKIISLLTQPFSGFTLLAHVASSFQRFLYGFILAIAIGIPLGLLMALSKNLDRLISPFFESVRFIAPIAWVPFAALWFGTGIGGPVLIIFMGAFPPVLINTYRGAIHVDKKFIEAAQMLGAELIVASSGVGYMMVKGQASIQTDIVMSGMVAIGIIGLVIDVCLRMTEKLVSKYREN